MSVQLPSVLSAVITPSNTFHRHWYSWANEITQEVNANSLPPAPPSFAPVNASYVTLSTNGTLTAERVLTAGAGISITDGGPGGAVTVASTVTPGVPTSRTISTTAPLAGGGDLSADRTLSVSTFSSGASGIVPASGGGTVNFLRADGTWAAPAGGGGGGYPEQLGYSR
jgi:hypothetical protein